MSGTGSNGAGSNGSGLAGFSLGALHDALIRLPRLADLPADALEPMPLKGVAHDHVRLRGRRLVARIPRWSQLGLDAWTALDRQAAAFRRAEPSGHTPRFAGLLPPGEGLPQGALLVGEVEGRTPVLPGDMPAIARALAALHRMAPPDFHEPLPAPSDPVAALLSQVERQTEWFDRAPLSSEARALIAAELDAARTGDLAPPPDTPMPLTAVGVDVHPGNFLIDAHGKAWFTDLEKLQYGHPASDLAHASLYSSTRWDPAVDAELTPAEVEAFIAAWTRAVPGDLADEVRPWLKPLRRLTWLRTLSWMARWSVEGATLSPGMPEALRAHMDAHASDILRANRIEQVRQDWIAG
ncbi:aminoglycoside phosphotransferase (plasmid) [Azospirillum sp. B510]|uniref:phosphotransferase family protein n=1 Tax=Azospirillum sp. (strain B510) TaxID=137722 RepID=UPI0001C4CE42|nr:aminoglycoside phosphotransferase family protein [Azospirillum sp. B510]BAI76556.1 aminoglycoside phosphotransferase [Azospirillum sp. B510]